MDHAYLLKTVYYPLMASTVICQIIVFFSTVIGVMYFKAIELNPLGFPLCLVTISIAVLIVVSPFIVFRLKSDVVKGDSGLRFTVLGVGVMYSSVFFYVYFGNAVSDVSVLLMFMGVM